MRWQRLFPLTAVLGVVGVLVWADVIHWRSSYRRLGRAVAGKSEAVIVLGFRDGGTRPGYVNRYRVRAGLRSFAHDSERRVLVLCGGPVGGAIPESDLMAGYARELGFTGDVRLDRTSASTWENIVHAIPLVEDVDIIRIVSNSLHAEKGRAYLWKMRPDLAERLARGQEHRWGEATFMKVPAAMLGLRNLAGK